MVIIKEVFMGIHGTPQGGGSKVQDLIAQFEKQDAKTESPKQGKTSVTALQGRSASTEIPNQDSAQKATTVQKRIPPPIPPKPQHLLQGRVKRPGDSESSTQKKIETSLSVPGVKQSSPNTVSKPLPPPATGKVSIGGHRTETKPLPPPATGKLSIGGHRTETKPLPPPATGKVSIGGHRTETKPTISGGAQTSKAVEEELEPSAPQIDKISNEVGTGKNTGKSQHAVLADSVRDLAKKDYSPETFSALSNAVDQIENSIADIYTKIGFTEKNQNVLTDPKNSEHLKDLNDLGDALKFAKRPPSESIRENKNFATLKSKADLIAQKLPDTATMVTISEYKGQLSAAFRFYSQAAAAYKGMQKTRFAKTAQFDLGTNDIGEKVQLGNKKFKSTVDYKKTVSKKNIKKNIPTFEKKLDKAKMEDKTKLLGSASIRGINQGVAAEADSFLTYAEAYLSQIPKTTLSSLSEKPDIPSRDDLLKEISNINQAVKMAKKSGRDADTFGMSQRGEINLTSLQDKLILFIGAVNSDQKASKFKG
jgi:hypothetical protein